MLKIYSRSFIVKIITRIEALVFDANPGKIYQSMENVNLGVFLHADSDDSKVMRGVNFHRGGFLSMSFTWGIKFHEDPSIPRA